MTTSTDAKQFLVSRETLKDMLLQAYADGFGDGHTAALACQLDRSEECERIDTPATPQRRENAA